MANVFSRFKPETREATKSAEFAVIGLGRFGRALARRLVMAGHGVLGIDSDAKLVQSIADEIDEAIILDATNEEALREIDIAQYETAVVAIIEDFEASTLITISLKRMGVKRVIAIAHSDRHRDILLRIGADRVVQPLQETGGRLADELAATGIIRSMPVMPNQEIAEVIVPESLVGKTVAACVRRKVVVLAIVHEGGLITSPAMDTVLNAGDLLVLLGEAARIDELGRSG